MSGLASVIQRMRRGLSVTHSERLDVLDAAEAWARAQEATAAAKPARFDGPEPWQAVPAESIDAAISARVGGERLPAETGYVHPAGKR